MYIVMKLMQKITINVNGVDMEVEAPSAGYIPAFKTVEEAEEYADSADQIKEIKFSIDG